MRIRSSNTIFSLYGRTDNHKVTGSNSTYKINLTQFLNNFKLSLTHSTGLRNPSLYELYGENGRTDSYKHVGNLDAKSVFFQIKRLIHIHYHCFVFYNFLWIQILIDHQKQ